MNWLQVSSIQKKNFFICAMSEEEDDVDVYKVYFKIIEEYWHVLDLEDYKTFDQFLEDLMEEWNKNKGKDAAFRKTISDISSTERNQFHFCVLRTLE